VKFVVEALKALLMAGVPIGVFSFTLVWWALWGGHLKESFGVGALESEMKAMVKTHKKGGDEERVSQHPVQKKWASFGGGFYGVVAFFTYIVIELQDIVSTITNFGGFSDFLRQLDIGLIVDMFVEALMNFIAAVTWPLYWMSSIDAVYVWVWFVAAYLGYWLGLKLAQKAFNARKSTQN